MPAGALKVEILAPGPPALVSISGPLDEDADLAGPLSGLASGAILDLAGLTRINSCGLRSWIQAIQALEARGPVAYRRVPVFLIQQFNQVLNARGHGAVESFQAPYYCDACDRESTPCIDSATVVNAPGGWLQPPAQTCAHCAAPLSFDDDPERYFLFLEISRRGGGA